MSKRTLFVSVLALAGLVSLPQAGCSSAEERDSSFDGGEGESSSGTSGNGGGSSGLGGSSSSGGITGNTDAGGGCSDASKLVYVLSAENDLYSFNPAELEFVKIGQLDCEPEGFGSTPNSMAVDRSGTAWVGYSDGQLFKVSTEDASCESTSFDYRRAPISRYGMGFSSDTAGSEAETLYLTGNESDNGLFSLDTASLELAKIGDFGGSLDRAQAELTGTGDAKLYGFFALSPAILAQVDKTTGVASSPVELETIDFDGNALAFAFSFWGGDFWLYSSVDSAPSKVTRVRTATDGSESVVVQDVGDFRIVGAGVSTCAPTSPVN